MTKKKIIVLTGVVAMTFTLAVLLFGLPRGNPLTLPISPDKVSYVGRYFLDDTRFIEIKKSADGFEYYEGRQQPGKNDSTSQQVISYAASEIESIRLDTGWTIEFTRPDQLRISLGTGEVVDRTFGEAPTTGDSEPTNTTITRRRSTQQ